MTCATVRNGLLAAAGLWGLAGCGGKKDGDGAGGRRLNPEEIEAAKAFRHEAAEAYYAENPEFFRTATAADLPPELVWEDGMEQEEFASPEAVQGGTETIWLPDFPRTLRAIGPDSNGPFRAYLQDENGMRVVHRHPNTGNYMPGLAEAWAISEDRKTVYLKLDPEARYSDGVPATAEDYFFLFYFMRQEWHREPWSINWYHEKYTHITRYDDFTIAVGLTEAKPDPLRFFEEDVRPVPRHFYAEYGDDYVERYQWLPEPTTGPYVILQGDVDKGRSVTQQRLEDWWANGKKFWRYRFNPAKRRFLVTRDPNKAVEEFKQGIYDTFRAGVPEIWYDKLSGPEIERGYIYKAQFYNEVPRPSYAIRINSTKPLLDNRDIRVGLHHACNWDLVIQEYFRGDNERMRTTSDGYGAFTHPTLQPRGYSVEAAEEAFAKAGFTQRGGDGIFVDGEGRRLSFTLTTGYRPLEDILTILEREAAKAGVEFRLEVLDSTAGWKKAQEKKHELVFTALNTSVELYPRYFDFFHSYNAHEEDGSPKTHTNNMTMTSDPEIDALIDRYEASSDPEEIRSLAFQIEEKLYEEAAYIPGFVQPFYRCGFWRWVGWPDGFNSRLSRYHDDLCVHWIDEKKKEETLAARKKGEGLGKSVQVYEQYRVRLQP